MPVSRKRNPPSHSEWRNAVRGGTDLKTPLDAVRASYPLQALPKIASWVAKSQRHRSPIDGVFPKSVARISSMPPFATQSLDRELAWAIGTLIVYEDELGRYVNKREALDELLSQAKYLEAVEIVDDINGSLCWSLEMMAARIGLTSLVHGLEGQKNWISAQTVEGASVAANFYCYWFGVRSENDQNPGRYRTEIKTRIETFWTDANGKRFLAYQLAGEDVADGDEAEMLAQVQTHSVIDLYEFCVQLARVCAAEGRAASYPLYNYFLPFMSRIGDVRVDKISFLMGNLSAAIGFEAGALETDIALIEEDECGLSVPTLHQVYQMSNLGIVPSCDLTAVARSVLDMQLAPDRLDAARERLLQQALFFPRFSIGEAATSIFLLSENPSPIAGEAQHRRRFMSHKAHDPSALAFLPPEVSVHYGEFLTSAVGLPRGVVEYCRFDSSALPTCRVSSRGDLWWKFASAMKARQNREVAALLQAERGEGLPATRMAMWCEIEAMLAAGEINRAVEVCADFYRRRPELVHWLPCERLAARLDDMTVGQYAGSTSMALVVWLLSEHYDRDFRSPLSYAVDNYLDEHNVARPSQLRAVDADDVAELVFFLWSICTEDTLSLSLVYESQFELEEERLAILSQLKTLDPERSSIFEDEITLILRRQEVTKAIKSLDRSKISMDEEPIRDWARKNLRGKFDRFRALIEAGMETVSPMVAFEILNRLAAGTPDTKPFEIPDNEVSALFAEMLGELCRESSLNSRHGINSYLSLRIRHGTISGQLRRPSQEQHLLTTVSSGGAYGPNQHWYDLLQGHLGHEDAEQVSQQLGAFSREYDLLVDRFSSDYVQIRRPDKPKGLISYQFPEAVVLSFSSDAKEIIDFDQFLDSFFSVFWAHMGNVLRTVQSYIRNELRDQFDELFANASADILPNVNAANFPLLNDAMVRARSGLHDALHEMAEWFDVPQTIENSPLSFEVLAEIGKEMVRRLHPHFNPRLSITDRLEMKLGNALIVFTDAIYILFGNVVKHADMEQPEVRIEIDEIDGVLEMSFVSDCRDISIHRQKIEDARSKLKTSDSLKDLSTEGGTGFPKLANIMAFSTASEPVDIGINEETGHFTCRLRFSYHKIRQPTEEQDCAYFGS